MSICDIATLFYSKQGLPISLKRRYCILIANMKYNLKMKHWYVIYDTYQYYIWIPITTRFILGKHVSLLQMRFPCQ
jgi:hypothetical protein